MRENIHVTIFHTYKMTEYGRSGGPCDAKKLIYDRIGCFLRFILVYIKKFLGC